MNNFEWAEELNVAVTVCDTQGIVVYMNSKAAKTFSKDGGKELIGKSLMGCHSEKSQAKIAELMNNATTNTYTVEKNGVKKLIYQTPWFVDCKVNGLVELSMEIPFEMAHFSRD